MILRNNCDICTDEAKIELIDIGATRCLCHDCHNEYFADSVAASHT